MGRRDWRAAGSAKSRMRLATEQRLLQTRKERLLHPASSCGSAALRPDTRLWIRLPGIRGIFKCS